MKFFYAFVPIMFSIYSHMFLCGLQEFSRASDGGPAMEV
jgi:hypothetical protein